MSTTITITHGTKTGDEALRGLSALAVRAGTALQNWGRRPKPVLDRAQVEVRRRAELEARLALTAREAAMNRQVYQFIR